MAEPQHIAFDAPAFLAEAGLGRKIIKLKPKQAFFSQGGRADSIFYLQSGRAKLTVFSEKGKEATISLSPSATSLERSLWRLWVGCAWRLRPLLPPVQH
jgi:CRP-like cAMP-binding protein